MIYGSNCHKNIFVGKPDTWRTFYKLYRLRHWPRKISSAVWKFVIQIGQNQCWEDDFAYRQKRWFFQIWTTNFQTAPENFLEQSRSRFNFLKCSLSTKVSNTIQIVIRRPLEMKLCLVTWFSCFCRKNCQKFNQNDTTFLSKNKIFFFVFQK